MQRFPDWPSRLDHYIAATRDLRFRWGEVDCCLWACGAVEAMTGIDPAMPLRGRYGDLDGAVGALYDFAGGGLLETVRALAELHHKDELRSPLYAQRGDLVVARGPRGWPDGLGVCIGAAAAYLTPKGLRQVPLRHAITAWRI